MPSLQQKLSLSFAAFAGVMKSFVRLYGHFTSQIPHGSGDSGSSTRPSGLQARDGSSVSMTSPDEVVAN